MPIETGNPVFDYRAPFRRRAAAAQSLLIGVGLCALVAGGALWLATGAVPPLASAAVAIAGLLMCLGGLLWGFYWRRLLRRDFRSHFGPTLR